MEKVINFCNMESRDCVNCPYSDFFRYGFSRIQTENGPEKLQIWTLFTHCKFSKDRADVFNRFKGKTAWFTFVRLGFFILEIFKNQPIFRQLFTSILVRDV